MCMAAQTTWTYKSHAQCMHRRIAERTTVMRNLLASVPTCSITLHFLMWPK